MSDGVPEVSHGLRLVPVQEDPQCSETPLTGLESWITPSDLFYVRNHFAIPRVELSSWSLRVEGQVERPLELSYQQIRDQPTSRLVATLECAGNSRAYMIPPAEGIPLAHGAVSTAEWEGVPLARLLAMAGVSSGAREVVLEGADFGEEEEDDVPLEVGYAKSIPVEKAQDPNTLLAYRMNGEDLPVDHGWPLRAIVPGWYGMASVKWLTRVRVLERPFDGFFQTRRYTTIPEGTDPATGTPVTRLGVKAVIVRPQAGEAIAPGEYIITGYAWSGEAEVAGVGVSTDWGKTWQDAALLDPLSPYAWTRWEYRWEVTKPGRTIVMARARDSEGDSQPLGPVWNYRGYGNNACYPVPVEVRSP